MFTTPIGLLSNKGGVPRNGLISEWLFSNNLLDTSGNSNAAIAANTSFVNDRNGNPLSALRHDVALSASLAYTSLTFPDQKGSLCLWIKNDLNTPLLSTEAGGPSISPVPTSAHYPFTNGLGYFYSLRSVVDGRVDAVPLSAIDRSTWHLFVVTQEPGANGYKVYQNTINVYTGTGANNILPDINNELLSPRTKAEIDSYRVYNRVLTVDEITALFNE